MKRLLSFDILKIISFIAVVTIHVCVKFLNDIPSLGNSFYLIANTDCLVRFAVPVFLMVTGAIMLNTKKQISLKDYIIKYPLRITILLIFWLLVHALFSFVIYNNEFTFKAIIDHMINTYGVGSGSLWYLYCLIGAYLIIPVLRLFVNKSNSKYILYIILLNIILQFFTNTFDGIFHFSLSSTTAISNKLRFSFVSGILNYLLIGWYLSSIKINKKIRTSVYFIGLLSLIAMMIFMDLNKESFWEISPKIMSDTSLFTVIYSSALFLLFANIFKSKYSNKWVAEITKISFGAYIIHEIINEYCFKFIFSTYIIFASPFANVVIEIIIVSLSSLAISFLLGKIPVFKFLIYKK